MSCQILARFVSQRYSCMQCDLLEWFLVACILKEQRVQFPRAKFRKPAFRFGLFETTLKHFLRVHYERSRSAQTADFFRLIITINIKRPVLIGSTHVLARRDTAQLQPCLFPPRLSVSKMRCNISRFSRKYFIWLGGALEAEKLAIILSSTSNLAKW